MSTAATAKRKVWRTRLSIVLLRSLVFAPIRQAPYGTRFGAGRRLYMMGHWTLFRKQFRPRWRSRHDPDTLLLRP